MLAVLVIRGYQRAVTGRPAVQRVLRSNGASGRALQAIASGAGPWGALWQHGGIALRGYMPYPSWTDPGPQG